MVKESTSIIRMMEHIRLFLAAVYLWYSRCYCSAFSSSSGLPWPTTRTSNSLPMRFYRRTSSLNILTNWAVRPTRTWLWACKLFQRSQNWRPLVNLSKDLFPMLRSSRQWSTPSVDYHPQCKDKQEAAALVAHLSAEDPLMMTTMMKDQTSSKITSRAPSSIWRNIKRTSKTLPDTSASMGCLRNSMEEIIVFMILT